MDIPFHNRDAKSLPSAKNTKSRTVSLTTSRTNACNASTDSIYQTINARMSTYSVRLMTW